jgi:copper chaperone CopZ
LQYLSSKRGETHSQQPITNDLKTTTVIVQGMNCNHCKTNVERNLLGLPGIKEVTVNLQQESVTIAADHLDLGQVKSTVEGLGYIFVSGK